MRSRTVLLTSTSPGAGEAADARADVHREAADVVTGEQFAFAGVQAGADLQVEVADAVADGGRAADRAAGAVEHGERAVAERLHEPPAMALDLLAHQAVVALQQGPPGAVAELRGTLGRADDVGEQHRREHAVADDRSPHTGQEMLDLVGDGVLRAEPERPLPGKLRHSGRLGCARRRSASGARRGTSRARGAAPASGTARWEARRARPSRRSSPATRRRQQGSSPDAGSAPSGFAAASSLAADEAANGLLGRVGAPVTRRCAGRSRRAPRRSAPTRIPGPPPGGAAATPGRVPAPASGWEAANSAVRPQPSTMREQHRLLGADRVDHRLDVIDLLLQRRRPGDPIGHPAPAPVEQDQPRERRRAARRSRARDGSSQNSSMFDRYDGTSTTSSGPSPTTW